MTAWRILCLCVATALALGCVESHPPPDPVADALDAVASAQSRAEREVALDAAGKLPRDAAQPGPRTCASAERAARAAATFDELSARHVVLVLAMLPCPEVVGALVAASRGEWQARTGVLRALAVRALADPASRASRGADLSSLYVTLSADPTSDLVRAAALGVRARNATGQERVQLLAAASGDSSPIVREALGIFASTGEGGSDAP